ncbi:glycosyltransferase [Balneolaceae bacterium]|nr:glycosyltransferase [Balneolaceae bacterium]
MGFADGWVYNPNSLAFARLNSLEQVKRRLLSYYKIKRLKCEGDHFILETDDAREKFINLLDLHDNDVTTVSNTYNSVFDEMPEKPSPLFDKNTFNLLTISAHYPNKNLEIINKVLAHLPSEIKVKFYLTLPNDVFMSIIRKSDRVINLGVQSINDCPVLLHSCDAVFLPTLLETFSASYPEAMKMNKPILTSDLSFAKSICGEAAEYFNPLDAEDIANKLVSLIGNKTRIEELVKLGRERLKKFPSANQRASKYLDICEKFLKKS